YGLEGRLNDGLAGEIIRTAIVPEFQQGNLRRGIGRGLDRISRVVRGEVVAVGRVPLPGAGVDVLPVVVVVPFFAVFVALGGFTAGVGLRTRTIAPLVAASLFTAIPLVIAAMMSPASLAALLPLELLALWFGYHQGRSEYWKRTLRAATPGRRPDNEPEGWIVGGTSDSSDGGSSFSSDFGGGSSGGGGASGRW
ncbi:MAG TPA: TPM domain-containing protein, partial [Vicinamibacterales bacterium]